LRVQVILHVYFRTVWYNRRWYDTLSAKKDSRLYSVSGRACTKELENDMISLQRQPQLGKVEGDTRVSGCQVMVVAGWTFIRESYYTQANLRIQCIFR